MNRTVHSFALAAVALSAVGCGGSSDRVAVYPVSGKVIVRGAPAEGAMVVLFATEQQDARTPIPKGVAQADGTFRLTSYEEGDGAPAGTYKATVQWLEPIPENANSETFSAADRLGGRYATPDKSGLEVTVTEESNELEPFELK